jgi:hypothetical protein
VAKKKKKSEENNGAAAPKPAGRARSTSAKSTSSRKKAAKPRQPKAVVAPAIDPTDEEIRIRAYFIAERRHRFDLAGDADSDWLEAKRQLLSELEPR